MGAEATAPSLGDDASSGYEEAPELRVLAVLALSRAGLDARMVEAATLTVAATGRMLLTEKGFATVEELSQAQRDKWRAEAKRLACAEVEVKLGLGVYETRILVGLACAPTLTRRLVIDALDRGVASWAQIKAFWQRCGKLPSEAAELVAEALLGTDPAAAAKERLAADGALRDVPWQHSQYRAALEREAVAAKGTDAHAERSRRRAAYHARSAGLSIDEDGSATLTVTGPLVTMCALHRRIDTISRLLRKHGDPRTLDQLRSDVINALLLHGTLPLLDTDPDALDVADLAAITQIVNAQPSVHLQVVIPWHSLTDGPACPGCHEPLRLDPDADHSHDTPHDTRHHRDDPAHGTNGRALADGNAGQREGSGGSGRVLADGNAGQGMVGEILGAHPAFITPGHARELAVLPGTTLSRLLVDPADGRLLERSIATYRPDAAMRRQIRAADVYSRSPGSRRPLSACELDHVIPWGPSCDGPTCELNLAGLAKDAHDRKTKKLWSATINTRRDLTWTTLLGQTFTTRAHDYRQYTSTAALSSPPSTTCHPSATSGAARLGAFLGRVVTARAAPDLAQIALDPAQLPPDPAQLSPDPRKDPTHALDERRDLANRTLYAAIAHRGPGAYLIADDDYPGTGEHGGHLAGWAWITHTDARTGSRRFGPPRNPVTVDELLDLRREGPEPSSHTTGQSHRSPNAPLDTTSDTTLHPRTDTPWTRRQAQDPPPF
ncbi:MAG: HNH endonuclease signature motif containing protein [Ornithinimicrobium sp.]|uniref:HNH endonuclease signature motif containing protein n=1 Tax=Ornithinimicrobium sp. TaxID=1977084 RepID=UPI0026DFE177|nr:HNH endonuclease signature motif containing protein [Ornithinimicrobium sp.]MDO5740915.1 HNH endonuclease signature motif containing protein [Ornithinimicrobium sp.]